MQAAATGRFAFDSKWNEQCKRRQPAHLPFIPSGIPTTATTDYKWSARWIAVAVASVFCTVHVFVRAQISAEPYKCVPKYRIYNCRKFRSHFGPRTKPCPLLGLRGRNLRVPSAHGPCFFSCSSRFWTRSLEKTSSMW